MFSKVKEYLTHFHQRFSDAPKSDKGMLIGGVTGTIYAAFRALFTRTAINVPLAGNIVFSSPTTRFLLGALTGGFVGSTFGNRYGQITEKFFPKAAENNNQNENSADVDMDNQTFMMKTMPFICGVAANVVIICFPIPGGNPLFGVVRMLSTSELHILTTLNGLFVGGTIGYRGGKFIDYVTNGALVSDLGLYRGYKYLVKKYKDKTSSFTLTRRANTINI